MHMPLGDINKMTAIDDFVEKYESKIDKIKNRVAKNFVRGLISGVDIIPNVIELLATRGLEKKALEDGYATKVYTIGMKDMVHGLEDYCCTECGCMPKERVAKIAGIASGVILSMQTYFIPSLVTGVVDLTNLYLKKMERKKQKKSKNIESIVGFGAVERLGHKLSRYEIKLIANHAGRDKKEVAYIKKVLKAYGRPYELYAGGFKSKCKCGALRNYCCC